MSERSNAFVHFEQKEIIDMMMINDDKFGESKCNISQIDPDEDLNNFTHLSRNEIDNLLMPEGVST
jgi:hypothetical protein